MSVLRGVALGAIPRVYEEAPLLADQLAMNYLKADRSRRQRARLDFAMRAYNDSAGVGSDFDDLRVRGFSADGVRDIAGITSLSGLSNRMDSTISLRPGDEFYLMGRVPRAPRS